MTATVTAAAKVEAARREVRAAAAEMRELERFAQRGDATGEDVRLARWARERWTDRTLGLAAALRAQLADVEAGIACESGRGSLRSALIATARDLRADLARLGC